MAEKKAAEKKAVKKEEKQAVSGKNRSIAVALNLMFGWMGGHRFYTGQNGVAVAQMFTMGGFGMWWFYDLVTLLTGSYKDKEGQAVTAWM